MSEKKKEVTLGGDPEFVLWKPGVGFLGANDLFSDPGKASRVGLDGHQRTGEIRYKPSTEVDKLVDTIRTTLLELRDMIPETVQVRGGTIGAPDQILGGHIHVGHRLFQGSQAHRGIDRQTVVFLDYFLAVPLAVIEDKKEAMIRLHANYGEPLDFRTDIAWGFEYRTPYSWLWSPDLTKSVHSIAWLLTNSVVNEGLVKTPKITWSQMAAIQDALRVRDKKVLKSHALDALNWMQKFDGFEAVAKNIEFLQRLVEKESIFKCESDTLLLWGLRGENAPPKGKRGAPVNADASSDVGCAEIATGVGAHSVTIYIYGIKESRGVDFLLKPRYLGREEIVDSVKSMEMPLTWGGSAVGSGAPKMHDIIIGLSPRLRDHTSTAISLIKKLAGYSASEKQRKEDENMAEDTTLRGWNI